MSTWYDAERVSQPGSVVLQQWMAERARIKAMTDGSKYTLAELAAAYDLKPGTSVTERGAMAIATVYACVSLIAGSIASLPCQTYERNGEERKKVKHPYWWLLNEQPYPEISASVFWEYIVASMLLHGDGFARLNRRDVRSAEIESVEPYHPDRVHPFRDQFGRLRYQISGFDGRPEIVDASDVLHFPTIGFDGLRSISPVRHAGRNALSEALSGDRYSVAFFDNSARPDYYAYTEKTIDKSQRDEIRSKLIASHGGPGNAYTPAVLSGGLKLETLNIPARDQEILATRNRSVEEIARLYGVPPFMIGANEKTTSWGSGVENMGRGFVKYTLQRHLTRIEQELNRKIWPVRQKYFVEFNVSGLERGDFKSRNEGYRIALGRAGEPAWMVINEIRAMENLPPIEGGDKLNFGKQDNAQQPADQTTSQ